ncbi:hypothetical protein DFH09DRAFT_1098025 [Mycena vulgaris]|nr:hypothetical protein DFH09DRAFT_1098025 [Mycena vulgaris]
MSLTGSLDPAADAQAALSRVLDELQEVGVLQTKNMVNMEDLLQMPEEQVIEDATDEEIFEAVKRMRGGEQNRKLNGGDDNEEGMSRHRPGKKCCRRPQLCMKAILSTFSRETRRKEARAMVDSLQPFAVPKARTEKLPFWADFDPRDRFPRSSLSSAPIELEHS